MGLLLFGVAMALRITTTSEVDFVPPESPAAEPSNSEQAIAPVARDWRFWLRSGFVVFFLAAWLEGVASFYIFGRTYRNGSPSPTVSKTEPLTSHGRVVYVTPSDKALVDRLKAGSSIGIPSVLLLGVLLQYVFKIDVFQGRAFERKS